MKKIVLAIDDDLLREVYKRGLIKSKFKVFPVQTKKEIFDVLEKEEIDLVLVDVAIENVRGLDILEEIQEKKKIKIPTIVFSALDDRELKERAKRLGAKEFLVSIEVSPDELVKKIKSFLK